MQRSRRPWLTAERPCHSAADCPSVEAPDQRNGERADSQLCHLWDLNLAIAVPGVTPRLIWQCWARSPTPNRVPIGLLWSRFWSRVGKSKRPLLTTIGLDVVRRVAPLLIMARAAATSDAELAGLLEEVRGRALVRMAHNAEALAPHLREGVTVEHARDVLYAYLTPELFDTLVHGFGWSLADWADFQARGIAAQLL